MVEIVVASASCARTPDRIPVLITHAGADACMRPSLLPKYAPSASAVVVTRRRRTQVHTYVHTCDACLRSAARVTRSSACLSQVSTTRIIGRRWCGGRCVAVVIDCVVVVVVDGEANKPTTRTFFCCPKCVLHTLRVCACMCALNTRAQRRDLQSLL